MTMYSGAVCRGGVLGMEIARNYRQAGSFWKAIPFGYAQSVVGVAALLLGGALDFVWHSVFGFEHQLDLLLSPPHLFLLTGLFFLITGPVRSGLARPQATNLLESSRCCLARAGVRDHSVLHAIRLLSRSAHARPSPFAGRESKQDEFVLSVFLFYRQALEISIVIWQSVLLAAAILYLCARTRLHAGRSSCSAS